ncbi:MAG: dienelactone hydrolase family protein, partial [Burkholderiales bacterium]|nr:dienelactone hydrolase family protein [Burkholderiales bacterium]
MTQQAQGTWIQIPADDGGSFKAYLAVPRSGKGPGIVLCQEIFGVNGFIREVADYYAEEGYTVLAPDLFWRIEPGIELGYTEDDWKRAFDLFGRFDTDKGMADITATVKMLRGLPQVAGKVGALGFCLGGRLAYLAAARSGVDCAVGYYGVTIDQYLDDAKKITVP